MHSGAIKVVAHSILLRGRSAVILTARSAECSELRSKRLTLNCNLQKSGVFRTSCRWRLRFWGRVSWNTS